MKENNHKKIATDFLKLSSRGSAHEAFGKYVGEGFKHHNVHFKGDATTLMEAMDENALKNPDKCLDIKHIIQEGNMVVVHSYVKHNSADPGFALIHIFLFESAKIIELWDLAQPVPAETINENGMF
jgi:predicted SnoaL-like aldol condensation-catalyzing enzyme